MSKVDVMTPHITKHGVINYQDSMASLSERMGRYYSPLTYWRAGFISFINSTVNLIYERLSYLSMC